MNITVRRAVSTDIDWLLSELKKFSAFLSTRRPLFESDAEARALISRFVECYVVFVAERPVMEAPPEAGDLAPYLTERLGFIGGAVVPHPLNPKIRVLAETFWWVSEEHRRSRAALLLLNAFVEHGKVHADWMTVALEALSPVNERCLLRRGFQLQERAYLMEIA